MKAFRLTLLAALVAAPAFANAATMQCTPFMTFGTNFPTGANYSADLDGIVTGVNANDVVELEQAGCTQIGISGYTLIGRIVNANMNIATDQPVPAAQWFVPAGSYWSPGIMIAKDCSISLTTAAGAAYDTAAKAGNRVYGSGITQAFSGCTGPGTGTAQVALLVTGNLYEPSATVPILSLTTAQGAAATASVYFYGYVLGK